MKLLVRLAERAVSRNRSQQQRHGWRRALRRRGGREPQRHRRPGDHRPQPGGRERQLRRAGDVHQPDAVRDGAGLDDQLRRLPLHAVAHGFARYDGVDRRRPALRRHARCQAGAKSMAKVQRRSSWRQAAIRAKDGGQHRLAHRVSQRRRAPAGHHARAVRAAAVGHVLLSGFLLSRTSSRSTARPTSPPRSTRRGSTQSSGPAAGSVRTVSTSSGWRPTRAASARPATACPMAGKCSTASILSTTA